MAGPQSIKVPLRFLPAFSFYYPAAIRDFLDDSLACKLLKQAGKGDEVAAQNLEFLARFNEETYKVYFRDGKNGSSTLHNTPELYAKVHEERDARRKDVWGSKMFRIPLSPNNLYPVAAIAYTPNFLDEKILAVMLIPLSRQEIAVETGLKKWVVYERVKCLQDHGLIRPMKKALPTDLVRFISTKVPA